MLEEEYRKKRAAAWRETVAKLKIEFLNKRDLLTPAQAEDHLNHLLDVTYEAGKISQGANDEFERNLFGGREGVFLRSHGTFILLLLEV